MLPEAMLAETSTLNPLLLKAVPFTGDVILTVGQFLGRRLLKHPNHLLQYIVLCTCQLFCSAIRNSPLLFESWVSAHIKKIFPRHLHL